MDKEVNLLDLVQVVIDADTWTEAVEAVEQRLGKTVRNKMWRDALEGAAEDEDDTLDVLQEFALSRGWEVDGAVARLHGELEDLREENLRLKGNLEHYAKQLRDVPPPGTKERLAEALERLQTETLLTAHLRRVIVTMDAQRFLERAELSLAEARKNEKVSEKAYRDALSRGGKGGLESSELAAAPNPEE